jgi:hypothetical protein
MHFTFNRYLLRTGALMLFAAANHAVFTLNASNLDTVGVTLLQSMTTNLNGAGVRVAQAEALLAASNDWEVNPSAAGVGQPASLFTYTSTGGSSSSYPNSVGVESTHADTVAGYFYGIPGGVATNVAHVDNYYAGYFYNSLIAAPFPPNINDPVVNQSFIFSGVTINQQQTIDTAYDNYSDLYNTLFVSGPGNGGAVSPPATCYNGIAVGAYGGSSSVGPTLDNGRAKPDICAPAGETSYSTPQVAGAAAVLVQAGLRGDGGSDVKAAADIRTIKALLLNGAIKPSDWINNPPSPLDARYGAGVLNLFDSYEQLAFGKHGYIVSNSVPTGGPHPPTGATGTISTLSGWDFNTNSSSQTTNGVNHYYFNVTNGVSNSTFTATATLVWNRQQNRTGINDLDLFLYDAVSSNLVASSTSAVDNVEHLFVKELTQGRYDLQVLKNGGTLGLKRLTTTETYALAFEFFSMPLNIALPDPGTNAVITWPVYPTGFVLLSTPVLAPQMVWTANNPAPTVTNSQNQVVLDSSAGSQYFRLRRP